MFAFWFFFIMECFIMHFFLPVGQLAFNESVYIALIIINSIFLIGVLIKRYFKDNNFLLVIILAFLFRLLLMFWSEYCSHIFTLPNSGADELTYFYNAMSALVKGKEFTGYSLLFSWQAQLFGLSKLFGKFVNVLFSMSALLILRRILIRLNISYNTIIKVFIIASFLPNFAIISSLLLRESLIIMLIAISAYFFIVWWQEKKAFNIFLAICASLFATWLHSGLITYTLAILSVFICARRTNDGRYFRLFNIRTILISIITCVSVFVILMNTNLGFTDYFRNADTIEDIVIIADAYEEGGSAYNPNIVNNDSLAGFIINTPSRMLYFMFSPVPWNWRSATDIIAFIFSSLFYAYVFFKSIPLLYNSKHSSLTNALFMTALLTLLLFGWGVSNAGTALRHRDKMVIHYLIMLAILLDNKSQVNRYER